MADTTLTSVPASVYAGDTLNWLISFSDFPASDGWVLSYGFRSNNGSAINFSSSSSGDDFALDVTAADTATWVPGSYKGVARVVNGSVSHTIWKGSIEVLPNPLDTDYDPRSHARKCLDAINAVLEGKASKDVLSTTIAGQSIQRLTWTELLQAKSFYQGLVDGETNAENLENGQGSSSNVLIRFGNP